MQEDHDQERKHDDNPGKGSGNGDKRNPPGQEVTIIVNGREKTVEKGELTFDQLVNLAFDDPPTGQFICFTITYKQGRGNKPGGSLDEGKSLRVKEGMIFNVTATDKS